MDLLKVYKISNKKSCKKDKTSHKYKDKDKKEFRTNVIKCSHFNSNNKTKNRKK